MKYWKTRWCRIEEVEVERVSDSTVWIGGRRNLKKSSYEAYFPTWEEAHQYILEDAELQVVAAHRKLELANSRLGNIKGMKNPETTHESR